MGEQSRKMVSSIYPGDISASYLEIVIAASWTMAKVLAGEVLYRSQTSAPVYRDFPHTHGRKKSPRCRGSGLRLSVSEERLAARHL
jgi:hypothetical protein